MRLLDEAGIPGAESLGGQLMLLHEGVTVARTVGGRRDAVETARSAAQTLLQWPAA